MVKLIDMPADHLKQIADNLKRFNLQDEENTIIEKNKDVLADLQAEQWGGTSKDYAGREIKLLDNSEFGGGYKPFTIEKKKTEGAGLGRITDRITLFQTGALYKELFVTITGGKFFFTSHVPYFTTLMKRTGDVTGLSGEQSEKFFDNYTRPGVQKALTEKVGIGF
jgi:hypothetical protein